MQIRNKSPEGKHASKVHRNTKINKGNDKQIRYRTKERIRELINKTKIDPNSIWQARRAARSNNELEYNTITDKGKEQTEPEETKEHIL